MKIAVWSGPRNLSTAMLYAFGCRSDFSAWDEPFYGAYLQATGINHPFRDDILAAHEVDAKAVADKIRGDVPKGKKHWYMKHMPLHMVEGFPMDWAEDCVNVHLIRHPARVVASYRAKRGNPTLRDIGFAEQLAIFKRFPGPVMDSASIRRDPAGILRKMCDIIELEYHPTMINWPIGPKNFDGTWAPHWYCAAHRSTGFTGEEGPLPELTGASADLVEAALPSYLSLASERVE